MNVALCHYHLQRGGVTRIIHSQADSLQRIGCVEKIRIFCGFDPEPKTHGNIETVVNPHLNYLPQDVTREECHRIKDDLYRFFEDQLEDEDILHMHNPNLGKNPVLTYVLYLLSRKGLRLFYHCHDFAEDRAPNTDFNRRILGFFGADKDANAKAVLYPEAPRCHFGVINSKDFERLRDLRIGEDRIRYVPNPVGFGERPDLPPPEECKRKVGAMLGIPEKQPVLLYPVRVIRRKNIGELILLAVLFRDRASWLVTLAPHNPVEKRFYHRWKAFNREIGEPVLFEAGHSVDFPLLMQGADRIITTSIQEGFGMTYLEPWLFSKPVVGRRIPYVVSDFEREGMVFDGLYDGLPLELNRWPALRQALRREGRPKRSQPDDDAVDYGRLTQDRQMAFIRGVLEEGDGALDLIRDWRLETILFGNIPADRIAANRRIIEERYSLEGYGKRLCTIYRALSERAS
jgi:glycosyltransferase involved in cell wall biosynthesis